MSLGECPSQNQDTKLMFDAVAGDVAAFEHLYKTYLGSVRGFIAARSGRRDAEFLDELAQEVFTRVWRQRDHFRGTASFSSYLMGVALNVWREVRVAPMHTPLGDAGAADERESRIAEPKMEADRQELLEALFQTRGHFSPQQWQAIELTCLAELPPSEAAPVAGVSAEVFRNRLCRARKQLQELLAPVVEK